MKWDNITDEKPDSEFRERVLSSAEKELKLLRSETSPFSFWQRRTLLFAGLTALVLGLIPLLRRSEMGASEVVPSSTALLDHEMLDNAELLNHLEMLDDLDILEAWNGKDV